MLLDGLMEWYLISSVPKFDLDIGKLSRALYIYSMKNSEDVWELGTIFSFCLAWPFRDNEMISL